MTWALFPMMFAKNLQSLTWSCLKVIEPNSIDILASKQRNISSMLHDKWVWSWLGVYVCVCLFLFSTPRCWEEYAPLEYATISDTTIAFCRYTVATAVVFVAAAVTLMLWRCAHVFQMLIFCVLIESWITKEIDPISIHSFALVSSSKNSFFTVCVCVISFGFFFLRSFIHCATAVPIHNANSTFNAQLLQILFGYFGAVKDTERQNSKIKTHSVN